MRREELNIGDFEAIDTPIDTQIDTLLDKNERIEIYAKYLPKKPSEDKTLSRICSEIIKNKLIGTNTLQKWLGEQSKTISQIVLRELFHIFSWRLIKNHKTRDIYHFIRISNKLKEHAQQLGFSELTKYIEKWRDKILKENLREIIRIRRQFIQKSKNQKSEIIDTPMDTPIDTPEKPKDKNEIIDQIVNLLLKLKE